MKKALYNRITNDVTIMAKLQDSPYMGRLPGDTGKISKTKAAIVITGGSDRIGPDKERQSYTMDVFAYSHDLVEDVFEDLVRLFVVSLRGGKQWRPLAVSAPAGKALIRFESETDLPDETSELNHKVTRWTVLATRVLS